jgi:transcription initiation factor TFIID TATA-box-binding protein
MDPTAMHMPTVSVAVTNVVCSVDMGCSVDMMDVALRGRNTEFNKKNGEGGVTLAQRGGSTATVHASGKVVFMGAQSEAAARVSARKHVRSIQKLG